jgi:hypothetical protein
MVAQMGTRLSNNPVFKQFGIDKISFRPLKVKAESIAEKTEIIGSMPKMKIESSQKIFITISKSVTKTF